MICDDMANKWEIDTVALQNLRIALLELILDIARAHFVEAEVLKDIPE